MKLSEIFEKAPEIEIEALNTDSRKKIKNSMFFCLDGFITNGHRFIKQAIANGAVCIVHSEDIDEYEEGVAYIKVANVVNALNHVVAKFYDYPSKKLRVYGVTGTNGKSSVTNLIRDIVNHFEPCGYIGTIAIEYNDIKLEPDLTTPDAIYTFKVMHDMVEAGVKSLALEVSSHGLEQHRVDAIDFDVAIFTNFTHDHLDFHGTMENYFAAKRKLFSNLKASGIAILNKDEPKYQALADATLARIATYSVNTPSDYQALNIRLGMRNSDFDLLHDNTLYHVHTNIVAMYNIYNLLAAIAALVESGYNINEVIKYSTDLPQIEGRIETIDEGQPFNVIVDFAHTPDGLEKIFEFGKMITADGGEMISVFGSAGKRDKAKRKTFGEIASKYCDMIILTEDDPRDENPRDIAEEIKTGINSDTKSIFIASRYDAIRQAIESANKNDTILILGKGDETFMYHEEGRVPYIGDNIAAKEIIKKYYLGIDENNA